MFETKVKYYNPHAGIKCAARRIKNNGHEVSPGLQNPFERERTNGTGNVKPRAKGSVEEGSLQPELGIRLPVRTGKSKKWKTESFPKMARSKFVLRGSPTRYRVIDGDEFRVTEWDGYRKVALSFKDCGYPLCKHYSPSAELFDCPRAIQGVPCQV